MRGSAGDDTTASASMRAFFKALGNRKNKKKKLSVSINKNNPVQMNNATKKIKKK